MTDDEKGLALIFISCLINGVLGGYKCHDTYVSTSPTTHSYTGSSHDSTECCKVEYEENSFTVTHFPCDTGCCGERDNQYCCKSGTSNDVPYVIGGSIVGVLALGGIVVLLVWIYRKFCQAEYDCSDHKKLLKEVYAGERLEELFVPTQPLVSAPGTIIHPMTNINGPFYTMDANSYVMPDLHQPQVLPQPPPAQPLEHGNNNDEDDNEENWDRWDGFPASADHVGISAITGSSSAGRGRDNPFFEGEGEEGAQGDGGLPYYYEHYDRFSQPPPGYEEVTK